MNSIARRAWIPAMLLIAATAAAGCSAMGADSAPMMATAERSVGYAGAKGDWDVAKSSAESAPAPGRDGAAARPVAFQDPAKAAVAPEAVARKVIYTADLKIVVTTIEPALVKARDLAEKAGGYLQNQTKNSITLRIPAEKFQAVLEQIEGLGSVADRQVKSDDVTDQFIDLEARLKNARTVETRLRELLARAKDVKEALEVERALTRIGEEIERFEGRLKLLRTLVALSTVTVEFSTKANVPTELEPLIRLPFAWIKELELKSLIEGGPRFRLEH